VSELYRPPSSDVALPEVMRAGGSLERSLAGDFEFEPLEVLAEAWRLTDGVKLIFFVGVVAQMFVAIIVQAIVGRMLPTPTDLVSFALTSFAATVIQLPVVVPIYAGMLVVALRHAAGQTVAIGDLFGQYGKTARLVGVLLLNMVLVYLGFILLILPGIYLMIAYFMALPLAVDKNIGVWQALETSRKVSTKCWWRMLFTGVLVMLILIVSSLALLIPLIWTVPMSILVVGVIYRNLYGVQPAGS
jgi:uncharacterized membrane protein